MNGNAVLDRLGGHGMRYAAGIILSKAVAFLMLPLYTRYLTPGDYGELQLVEMTLEVVSIVAGARLVGGVFHFYHKAKTPEERNTVLSTAFQLLAVTYAIAAAAAFLSAPWISLLVFRGDAQVVLIRVASVSLACQGLVLVPMSYLQVANRSGTYVLANIVRLVIQLSLNILLITQFGLGALGVLVSTMVASVIMATWGSLYQLRRIGLAFSRPAARELVVFGLPLVATQVAAFISTFGDRYFLQALATTTQVGIYALAYQFGFLLASIGSQPFLSAWDPNRFELARRPDRDALYSQAFILLTLLVASVATGIVLFVDDFIRIASAPAYRPAAALVPPIVAAYVFAAGTAFHSTGLFIKERTIWATVTSWIAAAVSLIGYIIMIPRYGGMGAAITTLVAFALQWLLVYVTSQRLWRVNYEWRPVLQIMGLAIGVSALGLLARHENVAIAVAMHSAIAIAYCAILWTGGLVPSDVRDVVRAAVLTLRRRLAPQR